MNLRDKLFAIEDMVQRADAFAEYHHGAVGQKRKYGGEDYIVHPREVMSIVKTVPHTTNQLCAALLHDTVEDTNATLDDVKEYFGEDIAALVEMLTDVSKPEDGNRKVRKEMDRQHTAQSSNEAKTVKLADLISNSKSITANDPNFARVYMAEKKRLLEVLVGGDPTLYREASQIVERYYK